MTENLTRKSERKIGREEEEARTHNYSYPVNITKLPPHTNLTEHERSLESILTNEVDGNGVHVENVHDQPESHGDSASEPTTQPTNDAEEAQCELETAITEPSSRFRVLCLWC